MATHIVATERRTELGLVHLFPPLRVLYLAVFLDMFAVGTIVPLLPYYATELGADAKIIGLLTSAFGFAQLIGGPFMGRISDTHGRKLPLLMSFAGAGIGYLGIGFATSLTWLFLTRLPVGLFKQTFTVSRAYISDVTPEDQRGRNMAYLGTVGGAGFIVGPLVGGYIASFGHAVPAMFSFGLFVAAFVVSLLFLPDSHHHVARSTASSDSAGADSPQRPPGRNTAPFSVASTIAVFHLPGMWVLLLVDVVFSLTLTLFRSNFAIFTLKRFDFRPRENGFVMSYVALLDVLAQFGLSHWKHTYMDSQLILASATISSVVYAGIAFSHDVRLFLVLLIPMKVVESISSTCISSAISKTVKKEELGLTLGVVDAFENVMRVVGPALGGWLMDLFSTTGSPMASALFMTLLSLFLWTKGAAAEPLGAAAAPKPHRD